jgi:hypothetical protein
MAALLAAGRVRTGVAAEAVTRSKRVAGRERVAGHVEDAMTRSLDLRVASARAA